MESLELKNADRPRSIAMATSVDVIECGAHLFVISSRRLAETKDEAQSTKQKAIRQRRASKREKHRGGGVAGRSMGGHPLLLPTVEE